MLQTPVSRSSIHTRQATMPGYGMQLSPPQTSSQITSRSWDSFLDRLFVECSQPTSFTETEEHAAQPTLMARNAHDLRGPKDKAESLHNDHIPGLEKGAGRRAKAVRGFRWPSNSKPGAYITCLYLLVLWITDYTLCIMQCLYRLIHLLHPRTPRASC